MNMYLDGDDVVILAEFFQGLGQASRLRILLALSEEEACVCHLEVWLGYRQAYLSQQLKVLRDTNLVKTSRIGKHIFYSLSDHAILDLIKAGSEQVGVQIGSITRPEGPLPGCVCPRCSVSSMTADSEDAAEVFEEGTPIPTYPSREV